MQATLLIRSLSFVGFCFECPIVGFDVSRFLAVVADSVAELAQSDSDNLRDRTGWSSQMLLSQSEPS